MTESGPRFLPQEAKALAAREARGPVANPYRAGRSLAMSKNGVVASSHTLAALAGLDQLRAGGNAADAAVATAATLAVVEPLMTGMGGDAFVLYYEAESRRIFGLNGSGRSPRGLHRDGLAGSISGNRIDTDCWQAVTVPGAVSAWAMLLDRFGTRTLAQVLEPAIHYAEHGFPVTEIVQAAWQAYAERLKRDAWARRTYLVRDRAPRRGELFRSPNLADSLRTVAEGGSEAFYRGPIAAEIVRWSEESGGFLTGEDFAAHASQWVEPIHTDFRGYRVHQIPPNGQGLGVLLMLDLLGGLELEAMDRCSAAYLHTLVEAKKLAYADLDRYVADPDLAPSPLRGLLAKEYAAARRELIDPARAAPAPASGLPAGGDTVYLTAVDEAGNAASFINSLFDAFGAKIVGGETGILLQNRGCGFVLEPGHANEYAPGKRPYHTIIPGMVTREGELYLSYGLMGGPMQPQGHVQFLLNHLVHGLSVQEAVDAPRWRHLAGLEVLLEHGTDAAAVAGLSRLGHEPYVASGVHFGGAQAILVDPETGTLFGASDPRKDGAALGF